MRYISIDSAQPGMIVGKSIYNEQGSILVNYRVKLTERLISRMRDIGLAGLYIEDELSSDITVEDLNECKEQRKIPINRYICGCRKPVLLQIYFKLN